MTEAPSDAPAPRNRRRYWDGAVIFDPLSGRTFSVPSETIDILDEIDLVISSGVTQPSDILERLLKEVAQDSAQVSSTEDAMSQNLERWIELALRTRA